MDNFFAELKRRQIYRVGAAYAVVAWVLLQLVSNVAPALRLPDWSLTLVIVLLFVGFPIALIFAWINELKALTNVAGAAVRVTAGKSDWILFGALAAVIALILYQQLAPVPGAMTAQQQANAASPAQLPKPVGISVAVLPFVNLSSDKEQEFFSDGMTEEITSALAKVSNLRVVGRTSAFQFKGENKDCCKACWNSGFPTCEVHSGFVACPPETLLTCTLCLRIESIGTGALGTPIIALTFAGVAHPAKQTAKQSTRAYLSILPSPWENDVVADKIED